MSDTVRVFMVTLLLIVFIVSVIWVIGLVTNNVKYIQRVVIQPTAFRPDSIEVKTKKGLVINREKPYEIMKTENGEDIIVHFVKENKNHEK